MMIHIMIYCPPKVAFWMVIQQQAAAITKTDSFADLSGRGRGEKEMQI